MKLLADNMLGKLAKWLRFMGHDVLYPRDMGDKSLIELSRVESRILLTRDKELVKVKGLNAIYIESEQPEKQLKQVIEALNLSPSNREFSRCPECNLLLVEQEKLEVKGKVPEGVYERQNTFWHCENCLRYYCRGTHYLKIKEKMERLYQ
jgi:uncharacterized protein with PIN domain